jgi:flagellar motor switch/type III secretory pathway protein FliN/flagellar biogenesis protein FliO
MDGWLGRDAMKQILDKQFSQSDKEAPNSDGRAASIRKRQAGHESAEVNRWISMIHDELEAEDRTASAGAASTQDVIINLEFGRATVEMTAKSIGVGDVLSLDQDSEQPIDLVVNHRPVARGELLVIEGRLGVRIVELLVLMVCWLFTGPETRADDLDRSLKPIFAEPEATYFESPFGVVRGQRSAAASEADDHRLENHSPRQARLEASPQSAEKSRGWPATPLTPRSAGAARESDAAVRNPAQSSSNWLWSGWGMFLLLSFIGLGARWLKGRSATVVGRLPNEAFEILGRQAIDPRTAVLVARTGSRLLLLSLSPQGLRTLAEITDPVEVDCVAGLCRATHRDQTLVETFRSMLQKPTRSKAASQPATRLTSPELLGERILAARATSIATPVHQEGSS